MTSDPTRSPSPSSPLRAWCVRWAHALTAAVKRDPWVLLLSLAAILVTAVVELGMGRSLAGPDGKIGLWEGSIWSSGCSQRLLDPYSISHVAHGMVFYAALWVLARRRPVGARFLVAVLLEAAWEILENSPLIIERYREATIALGYEGDSVLNSISDVIMMSLGFLLTFRLRPWIAVTLLIAMELGCALWIRDNLTLNVIMLVRPVEAIKAWQMQGRPPL